MASSGMDLTTLVPSVDDDVLWRFDGGSWTRGAFMLVGFSVVFALIAGLRLRTSSRIAAGAAPVAPAQPIR